MSFIVDNEEYLSKILPTLSEPMPYKWRVQSFSQNKPEATCVAYIDSRDVMDRLDKVCIYGWHRRHSEIKGNIYCEIGVAMPDGSVIWRMDCGTESSTEKEKGESSDSFKRAAVNWGVGRFLYDLDVIRLPANEVKMQGKYPYVVDIQGKKVWDLTKHINSMSAPRSGSSHAPEDKPITDAQFKELNRLLDETQSDKVAFCSFFAIDSIKDMKQSSLPKATRILNDKLAKAKGEQK